MVKTRSTATAKAIEDMTAQLATLPGAAVDAKYRVTFGRTAFARSLSRRTVRSDCGRNSRPVAVLAVASQHKA